MGSSVVFDLHPMFACAVELPSLRGRFVPNGMGAVALQTLPDDAIGVFSLTLVGVVVGSAIQVEDAAGATTLYSGVAGATSVTLALSAYAGGSPLNSLRIKVRKGSASPFYLPFETLASAVVGAQSIFVSQISDE